MGDSVESGWLMLMQAPMFFWYVFIGSLVKGSNRYQEGRACFCHDTSATYNKKKQQQKNNPPFSEKVLHVCGKHKMGSDERRCWEMWISALQLQSCYKTMGGGGIKSFCVSTILEKKKRKKKSPPLNGN